MTERDFMVHTGRGAVYTYDAIGSYERTGFSCQGSGKDLMQPVLDNQLKAASPLLVPARNSLTALPLEQVRLPLGCTLHRTLRMAHARPQQSWSQLRNNARPFRCFRSDVAWHLLSMAFLQDCSRVTFGFALHPQAVDLVKDAFVSAGERDIYTGDTVEIVIMTRDGVRHDKLELKRD